MYFLSSHLYILERITYFRSFYEALIKLKWDSQDARKFGKLSSGHRTEEGQFSFQSQRKAMPKNAQSTRAMATHSSTLAWEIPWTEEPGRLQSMGSRRVGHDWATSLSLSCTGEGNGNPLHILAWRIPGMGAWWAALYGVAQSRTRLTWLSSSSMSLHMDSYLLRIGIDQPQTVGNWPLSPSRLEILLRKPQNKSCGVCQGDLCSFMHAFTHFE